MRSARQLKTRYLTLRPLLIVPFFPSFHSSPSIVRFKAATISSAAGARTPLGGRCAGTNQTAKARALTFGNPGPRGMAGTLGQHLAMFLVSFKNEVEYFITVYIHAHR